MQDVGSGVTLTSALSNAHTVTARVIDTSSLGTGITLTAPLAKAHAYGSTVNGSATGLLSDSPQGQIIGVLNNDQDGLNYPAHKWGTGYYMSNLLDGQAGPWFNNINATPVSAAPNSVYGTVGIQRLQHNLPAVQAFRALGGRRRDAGAAGPGRRSTTSASRSENPLAVQEHGLGAGHPGHPDRCRRTCRATRRMYTPVLDDRTGRTDQVSFGVRGIPSLGDIGQYDSSTDPLVGGNDNPYPPDVPEQADAVGRVRAGLEQRLLLEPELLGVRHRARAGRLRQARRKGCSEASSSSRRGSRTPSPRPQEGGAVAKPNRPIAYFEMTPKKPTAQTTVTLRRRLQPQGGRQDERAHVLLGLRRRQPAHGDDRSADPAHVPDAGRLA